MQSDRIGDRPGSLRRMWFRFEWPAHMREEMRKGPVGVVGGGDASPFWTGCGASGYDEDDCLALIRAEVFKGRALPEIRERVEDIDVSTLPDPVRLGLGNPAARGVWFPSLNLRPPLN